MSDQSQSVEQLLAENEALRRRVQELEDGHAGAGKRLRETRQILQVIIDNIQQYIFWKDADSVYLGCNRNFARAAGLDKPAEIIGRTDEDLQWRKEEAELYRQVDRRLREVEDYEYRVTLESRSWPDGWRIWIDLTQVPLHDPEGRVVGTLCTYEDITEHRQAEEALRESEISWRQVIDLVPHFIFAKDRSGRYMLANHAMARAYGTTVDQLLGKTDSDFVSREEARQIRRADLEVIDTGEPKVIQEEHIFDPSGEVRIVRTLKMPYTMAHSPWPAVLGVSIDITDLKRAEAEQRRLEAQFQQAQKLESLGVLAGGIAHDFNNFLTTILGNSALLLRQLSEDSPLYSRTQDIEKAAHRAAELTRQLLTYAGKSDPITRPFDLEELVEEMGHLLRVSISKGVELQSRFGGGLPPIKGDPSQIRQVVMNLILNASDAIEGPGGRIVISTEVVAPNHVDLSEAYLTEELPFGNYVVLEVSDTGCGMDEQTRKRLFDPFFTTKTDGRGLGMASVLGIVRAHHGAIHVTSERSQGTNFRIFFPALVTSEEDERAGLGGAWRGSGMVMIVDDDAMIRELAGTILKQLGFEVVSAEDGMDALEVYRAHDGQIDAVLLDMAMPRMDGAETFRQLRRLQPDLRILLSSGFYEQLSEIEHLLQEERSMFIRKPYQPVALMEKMHELLAM